MAHVADLPEDQLSSLELNNLIAKELSPSYDMEATLLAATYAPFTENSEKHVWRLHQPTEPRKCQLLQSAKEKLSSAARQKIVEEPSQPTMRQTASNHQERSLSAGSTRSNSRDQTPNRRRKISISDLGPMTTVQENLMDSREFRPVKEYRLQEADQKLPATIPGYLPVHRRSISVPGDSGRQRVFSGSIPSCASSLVLCENSALSPTKHGSTTQTRAISSRDNFFSDDDDEVDEDDEDDRDDEDEEALEPLTEQKPYSSYNKSRSASPQHPISPRSLAPLDFPVSTSAQLQRFNELSSMSLMHSRSEDDSYDIPPDVPPKPARITVGSPCSRDLPYTPMSSSVSSMLSASTARTSVSNTPPSALPYLQYPLEGRSLPKPPPCFWSVPEDRSPPRPWNGTSLPKAKSSPNSGHMGHSRCGSDAPIEFKQRHERALHLGPQHGHRRYDSESAASIVDRGRLQHRCPPPGFSRGTGPDDNRSPSNARPTASHKAYSSSCSSRPPQPPAARDRRAEEQRAFEHLPSGHPASSAPAHLPPREIQSLHKQALGQAARFQVLCTKDVEALSRELAALDERCEYLRKAHHSLRAGRRNLHERICSSLRSPPPPSHESHESLLLLLRQTEALSELDASIDDWVATLELADNRRTRVRQKLLEHVAAALLMLAPPSPSLEPEPEIDSRRKQEEHELASSSSSSFSSTRSPSRSRGQQQQQQKQQRAKSARTEYSIQIYADGELALLMADVESEIQPYEGMSGTLQTLRRAGRLSD
ncbi:uncharacterized protein L3040_005788 [Drepanopeziza brunnea f. sp. 'multigermtubi']|uniref:uncharacterized protein n=1 Tax=Drepanopeziza brunnea f. sp. 'multigermtubi' TaxID=698441 RepID=UPI0023A3C6B0|nr:hypothetical protein L3040_005788 [Drepanopeziza brunnea f. sp. 'multigermtubi']